MRPLSLEKGYTNILKTYFSLEWVIKAKKRESLSKANNSN